LKTLLQTIKHRRSIRNFLPEKTKPGRIRELIEAARWAPSAHNSQPWRFLLIEREEEKDRLAEAMSRAFRGALQKDGAAAEAVEVRVRESSRRLRTAPSLILVCLCREDCRLYPDRRRNRLEEILAHQGIGAAIQNILLMVSSHGLGACWISAPLFCPQAVRKALGFPKNWDPAALIAVGRPKGAREKGTRHEPQKILIAGKKGKTL
jgi:coenzyme F420-0:L-glutamate ligase / coenzyme F420-1:gamma-L-glutamate ligase